jgi:hypothetical protein
MNSKWVLLGSSDLTGFRPRLAGELAYDCERFDGTRLPNDPDHYSYEQDPGVVQHHRVILQRHLLKAVDYLRIAYDKSEHATAGSQLAHLTRSVYVPYNDAE